MKSEAPAPEGSNALILRGKVILDAVEAYLAATKAFNAAEKEKQRLKPILLAAIGDHPLAYAGVRVVTVNAVAEVPGTPDIKITKQMIGQLIQGAPGRASYKQLTVR